MSFIGELKRRNVFKVGVAYTVIAWLLAQITDVFLENFGSPDWVIKTVLLLLLIGFPLALFFCCIGLFPCRQPGTIRAGHAVHQNCP